MKFRLKDLTLRHYIRYMRRQSKHVQHVHAFIFAGLITGLIAGVLMYTEYGFWHETYRADDLTAAQADDIANQSPSESFSSFWAEAKARFHAIGSDGTSLLEGKETYTKEP